MAACVPSADDSLVTDSTDLSALFSAAADARVERGRPSTNFGASTSLVADSSPVKETYVRFVVTGLSTTVTRARLRLYVTNATTNGPAIYRADNAWDEATITYDNRPATSGSALANAGALSSGAWMDLDVTAAVGGNGTYTFKLVPESANAASFRSKEAGTNAPELRITTLDPPAPDAGPAPVDSGSAADGGSAPIDSGAAVDGGSVPIDSGSAPSGCPPVGDPSPIAGMGYGVVFQDCFTSIDPTRWRRAMYWEDEAPDDVYTDAAGIVHMVTRRSDGYPNRSLSTLGYPWDPVHPDQHFLFGYFEARMKYTSARGSKPAFWLMSHQDALNPNWPDPPCAVPPGGDPHCLAAEIDFFEHFPINGIDSYEFTLHRNTNGRWGVPDEARQQIFHLGYDLGADWHVYGGLWTSTQVCVYVDGTRLGCHTPFDSTDQAMFLTFYTWPSSYGPAPDSSSPDNMETQVDWVRVWQRP